MQTWGEHVENHERFLRDCLNKKAEVVDKVCDGSLELEEVCEKEMDIRSNGSQRWWHAKLTALRRIQRDRAGLLRYASTVSGIHGDAMVLQRQTQSTFQGRLRLHIDVAGRHFRGPGLRHKALVLHDQKIRG
jgi:hypothetical protein